MLISRPTASRRVAAPLPKMAADCTGDRVTTCQPLPMAITVTWEPAGADPPVKVALVVPLANRISTAVWWCPTSAVARALCGFTCSATQPMKASRRPCSVAGTTPPR